MIVVSVLLVVIAGVLLGVGLVRLDETLLYWSIGVSAVAAFTLAMGVRRLVAARAGRGQVVVRLGAVAGGGAPDEVRGSAPTLVVEASVGPRPVGRATPRPVGRATPPPHARAGAIVDGVVVDSGAGADLEALSDRDPTVPADEPAEQSVTQSDIDRIGQLTTEVVVIDGRPRYHLDGCVHLLGLEPEFLPALEAVELGFTPCGLCRPATALLGSPGR